MIRLHYVLVALLTDCNILLFAIKYKTNFSLFGKISTNATLKFRNRCFFKDMNFPELLHTVALELLSYLVINHMVIFLLYFPSIYFLWLCGVAFLKFLENYKKEIAWPGLYFVTQQLSGAETFCGEFSRIPRTNNQ